MSEEKPKAEPIKARLNVSADGLTFIDQPLDYLAVRARTGYDEVLTFLYRDPFDPEMPNERRPVRRARLVIEELGEL